MTHRYDVRIRSIEPCGDWTEHGGSSESLGLEIALAVAGLGGELEDETAALIVEKLYEGTENTTEFWPGQLEAFDELVSAARQIIEGWKQYRATKATAK